MADRDQTAVALVAEIIGPSGRVHYRRPANDPMVDEAQRTSGYSVRFVWADNVEEAMGAEPPKPGATA